MCVGMEPMVSSPSLTLLHADVDHQASRRPCLLSTQGFGDGCNFSLLWGVSRVLLSVMLSFHKPIRGQARGPWWVGHCRLFLRTPVSLLWLQSLAQRYPDVISPPFSE